MKPLAWIGSSRKDLMEMPEDIKSAFGFALFQVQMGDRPSQAKTLSGFGGASVVELVEDHDKGTYRAVYTVRFEEAIYVLHCFQKKSKSGIATPKQDIELIRSRLKIAEETHQQWKKSKPK